MNKNAKNISLKWSNTKLFDIMSDESCILGDTKGIRVRIKKIDNHKLKKMYQALSIGLSKKKVLSLILKEETMCCATWTDAESWFH